MTKESEEYFTRKNQQHNMRIGCLGCGGFIFLVFFAATLIGAMFK